MFLYIFEISNFIKDTFELLTQALSLSVESSKMCVVVIMDYNSFTVDYFESFNFNLVQIMTEVLRIKFFKSS